MKMSKVQMLRVLVKQRQSAAAEEILDMFETVIEVYRGGSSTMSDERHLKLLDADSTTATFPLRPDIQQVIIGEQVLYEQQEQNSSVHPELLQIKEEVEKLWSIQDGEAVPVKSQENDKKTQSPCFQSKQADLWVNAEALAEQCEASEPVRKLRTQVNHQLTAAVEEMLGLFEAAVAEYEEEIQDLRKLLGESAKPGDFAQLSMIKQEVLSEQQEWRMSLDQGNPELPHNQEQLWSSPEGKELQRLEKDGNKIPLTAEPVKSEDCEMKVKSPQLCHKQTGADGVDCGGSKPTRIFGPTSDLLQERDDKTYSSDDTENSDDYSQETPQSCLEALNYKGDSVSQRGSNPVDKRVDAVQNMNIITEEKPFSCSLCGKGFSEKSDLRRHVRFHTGEKPFTCVFCEKHFTEKADLKRHTRIHTREKPFSCSFCGKRFSEKTDLTRHIRVHTGEKPFSCSTCGKIFSQNENLRRHQRIHSGEKPFSCPVCSKQFIHRGAMVVHMRIHTGEKPFGCSVCGKRYIETGNMKKHMRVHTGEKPFSCRVCGRRFNYQSQVKSHKCSGENSIAEVHHS